MTDVTRASVQANRANQAYDGLEADGPAYDWVPITPSDTADLATPIRAIRADTAGNVVVITALGTTRTMAFAAGETRTIRATRVKSTNTTAGTLEGAI